MKIEEINIENSSEYTWSTPLGHIDNSETMSDWIECHMPYGAWLIEQDGSQADIHYKGKSYDINASGNGNSFNHKVTIERF